MDEKKGNNILKIYLTKINITIIIEDERMHPFFEKQNLYHNYMFASAGEKKKKNLFSITNKIEKKKKETNALGKKYFNLSSPPKLPTVKIETDEEVGLDDKIKAGARALGKKIEDPDRDTGAEYEAEKAKERVVD